MYCLKLRVFKNTVKYLFEFESGYTISIQFALNEQLDE